MVALAREISLSLLPKLISLADELGLISRFITAFAPFHTDTMITAGSISLMPHEIVAPFYAATRLPDTTKFLVCLVIAYATPRSKKMLCLVCAVYQPQCHWRNSR